MKISVEIKGLRYLKEQEEKKTVKSQKNQNEIQEKKRIKNLHSKY